MKNKTLIISAVSTTAVLSAVLIFSFCKVSRRLLRAAGEWVGVEEKGSNQGWNNVEFENKMRAVGWYPGAEWCNFFVKMVMLTLYREGSKGYNFWKKNLSPATQTTWANLQTPSRYHEVVQKPEKGCLVIYRNNSKPSAGHIEIVKKVNHDGSYQVISGNSGFDNKAGQGVAIKTRKSGISGFTTLGFIKIMK